MYGQIVLHSPFGQQLMKLARHPDYKVFLDVGSWNGLGTTKVLVDCIQNNTICKVYSVEANLQMYKLACNNWKMKPICLELLYGKLSDEMMTENEIRSHPGFNDIKPHFDIHYKQDVIDFQKAPIVSLPDYIDVAVLDGGEFSSEGDLNRVLKLNPKVIALDDTLVMKNSGNLNYLVSNGWYVTATGNDRNGWAVLERKDEMDDKLYAESFDRYCTALGY
jgi:hypothetical protein